MGTIVPRLLNYMLVPVYTRLLLKEEYGIVTELYAYIAFFFVLLLYGMETTFFRYAESEKEPGRVFSTSLISVLTTSSLFVLVVWIFIAPISGLLKYPDHQDFVLMAAGIVAMDAFTSIQFAYLRQQQRPLRFSMVRIITVVINVGLNLYYIWFCDAIYRADPGSGWLLFYNPEYRVGYVFLSNVISSLAGIVLLSPQLLKVKLQLDPALLRKMLIYAMPMLVIGISGMVNEVIDKIIFKYLAPVPDGTADPGNYILGELGVYGANYKLAVLMTLFIQMFRYAAEPFFFSQAKESNARQVYADVMTYFVIFGLLIFLGVTLFMDVFKYFIGPEHWEGLHIVPVVLLANLFLGIFYNLSVWYKLNDLTRYGAIIALFGSAITVTANLVLVPRMSYAGAAWGHLLCYLFMMVVSYYWGRKYYAIPYATGKVLSYMAVALVLFGLGSWFRPEGETLRMVISAALFLAFLGFVYMRERKQIHGARP